MENSFVRSLSLADPEGAFNAGFSPSLAGAQLQQRDLSMVADFARIQQQSEQLALQKQAQHQKAEQLAFSNSLALRNQEMRENAMAFDQELNLAREARYNRAATFERTGSGSTPKSTEVSLAFADEQQGEPDPALAFDKSGLLTDSKAGFDTGVPVDLVKRAVDGETGPLIEAIASGKILPTDARAQFRMNGGSVSTADLILDAASNLTAREQPEESAITKRISGREYTPEQAVSFFKPQEDEDDDDSFTREIREDPLFEAEVRKLIPTPPTPGSLLPVWAGGKKRFGRSGQKAPAGNAGEAETAPEPVTLAPSSQPETPVRELSAEEFLKRINGS